jgi:hypothetical protein
VNSLIEELLGLFKNSTSEDNNTSGTITDFVILRGGKLSEESGSLMMNLKKS